MIWFFRLSVLAYFATIVAAALLYPDRVPVHFDASGTADRFQSRGVAVLSMTGVGLVLGGLLGGCILFFRRGSLHHVNVPHRSWWMQPENQDRLRAMLAQDLAWVGGCTMTLLTVVLAITIRVADDPQPRWVPSGWPRSWRSWWPWPGRWSSCPPGATDRRGAETVTA